MVATLAARVWFAATLERSSARFQRVGSTLSASRTGRVSTSWINDAGSTSSLAQSVSKVANCASVSQPRDRMDARQPPDESETQGAHLYAEKGRTALDQSQRACQMNQRRRQAGRVEKRRRPGGRCCVRRSFDPTLASEERSPVGRVAGRAGSKPLRVPRYRGLQGRPRLLRASPHRLRACRCVRPPARRAGHARVGRRRRVDARSDGASAAGVARGRDGVGCHPGSGKARRAFPRRRIPGDEPPARASS